MSIKLKNLDAGIGVLFFCEGIVSGEDIIRANRKILSYGQNMNISKYCLIDYSNATKFDVSSYEIEIIASQNKEISEYISDYIVAIAAKKDLEFGVSRMWETIIETLDLKWETRVFRDKDNAEKWIKQKVKEKHNIDLTMA